MAKKKEETKQDPLKWMLTFSDMMTLLLCFFVMLIIMSSLDNQKVKKAMSSMKGSLGVLELGDLTEMNVSVESEMTGSPTSPNEISPEFAKWIKDLLKKVTGLESVKIISKKGGFIITFANELIFDSGSAELKESAKEFLDDIFKMLSVGVDSVEVQGHSDNSPVNGGEFSSNWDISGARAARVVRYLIEKGMDPEKLVASAFGDTKPLYPNITPEFKAKNRRVEIVVDSSVNKLNFCVREYVDGNSLMKKNEENK
jgi:chemotaxis protein MotB